MRATLGAGNVFHANESRYQQAPLAVLVAQYPVVAGHFSFAQIPDALFGDTFFFTFLREPVDRALSLYYYYRAQPAWSAGDVRMARARELDVEAFVGELPDRPSPWSDWQTFLFSGATDAERPARELLDAALHNLERVDFVGVHDDFDRGMQRLFELRGWQADAVIPRANVTEGRLRRDEIPSGARRRIEELNACDATLFARARELWEATTWHAGSVSVAASVPAAEGPPVRHARVEQGTREIVFTGVSLRAIDPRPPGVVEQNDRAFIELHGMSTITTDDVTLGIRITDSFGVEVYGTNTRLLGVAVHARAGENFRTTFAFDMILAPGTYHLTVAIHAAEDHLHKCYHWMDNAVAFDCRRSSGPAFSGLVDLKAVATLG